MNSLLTNVSALAVLQSLNATQKELTQTQAHISSGLQVASAADNAAYWSIATTMRSDRSALSSVKDALGIGAATIDVASSALNSAVDAITAIKSKLVAARQPGIDRATIQMEISQLQKQLQSTASSAAFAGESWLAQDSASPGYSPTKSIVASFTRGNGGITVGTIDIDVSAIKLYDSGDQSGVIDRTRTVNGTTASLAAIDISALTDSAADTQTLENYIKIADDALSDVNTSAGALGSVKNRIGTQQDFISTLMDAITTGVGQLVDADMSRESTKLQALQTQQQLGIQSLSIANANSQVLLKLFAQ